MLSDAVEMVRENVSRETFVSLQKYVKLLLHWNQKVNLISRKVSEDELWRDHVLDSLLLSNYMSEKEGLLLDVGSGAGFPGLVLAMNGHSKCCLVEINIKKAAFLRVVSADLGLKVDVRDKSISQIHNVHPSYITSRAMAPISEIVDLTQNLIHDDTEYIFHIGYKNKDLEILKLREKWSFELQEWINPYRNKCSIISMRNIVKSA